MNTDLAACTVQTLKKYSKAYYEGNPLVSDEEFDAMRDNLKRLDPNHPYLKEVGAKVSNTLAKVRHAALCGSLNNTFDAEGITAWMDTIKAAGGKYLIVMPKLDGLSLALTYKDGKLVRAATRGDGYEGEDVTANAREVPNIPHKLSAGWSGEVRGEVVVTTKDFEKYFKPRGDANPRNSAAGTIRRKDGELADRLTFYAYGVAENGFTTEADTLEVLGELGFVVPEWHKAEIGDSALTQWEAIGKNNPYPYAIDGIVLKVNKRSILDKLGVQDGCPRAHLACKWRGAMVAETTLRAVENQVGRTGRITPVAVMDAVDCGGVQVSRASLKNWDEIGRLEKESGHRLTPGCRVRIERQGMVIPGLVLITGPTDHAPFTRPDTCPSCGAEAYENGPFQVCRNPACPAQTYRTIVNWVKARNILHLGDRTIDALMAVDGPVETIADLYTVTEDQMAAATGSRLTAKKIMASLEKSRDCTLAQVVGCIGIPGIGMSEAEAALVDLGVKKSVTKLLSLVDDGAVPQIGAVTGKKFVKGVKKQRDLLLRLSELLRITGPAAQVVTDSPWSGKTFCISGPTDLPREALKEIIIKAGGTWKSSVVNDLSFLIVAASDLNTTKALAAKKKGIAVITEPQALDMAGYK